MTRGSRISLTEDKNTIRFFIWWKEKEERTDLDLSASFFNERWECVGSVWYGNLKETKYNAFHSGDVTSAPKGACEFIDADIPSCAKQGRYLVMTVNVFAGSKFNALEECHAGWMLRKKPNSGEIFDARTVEDKFSLSSSNKFCMPLIIDLWERKIIWADVGVSNSRYTNVAAKQNPISIIGKALTEIKKPNLYDLLTLHAQSRGKLVVHKQNASTVFDLNMAFEIDRIMAEYL